MSYETGFFKYILFTPLTIVGAMSMYAYGGGIVTLISTIHHILTGGFIEAFIEYFVISALPATSLEHIVFPCFELYAV